MIPVQPKISHLKNKSPYLGNVIYYQEYYKEDETKDIMVKLYRVPGYCDYYRPLPSSNESPQYSFSVFHDLYDTLCWVIVRCVANYNISPVGEWATDGCYYILY